MSKATPDKDLVERAERVLGNLFAGYATNKQRDILARFAQEVRDEATWIEIKNQKEWLDLGKELESEIQNANNMAGDLKYYTQNYGIPPGSNNSLEAHRKRRKKSGPF